MNLTAIIALTRTRLDDATAPYLVSDANITAFANEAVTEAAIRSRLLVDSTTAALTQIAAGNNSWQYSLDSRVLFVKRARFNGQSFTLKKISHRDLDRDVPGWQDHSASTPIYYFTDLDTGKLAVYPKLLTAATLYLTVLREPLTALSQGSDSPEIASRHHSGLINWILYRCYDLPDPDINNSDLALKHLALFEQQFGPRLTANEEIWINEQQSFENDMGVY